MIIKELEQGDENSWDNYVINNKFSTPLQLAAWKSIFEKVFNSNTHFLLLEEMGKVTGVLPLLHVKSIIAGNYITSLPGGLLANNDAAAASLLNYAENLVKTKNSEYLILRDGRIKWDHPDLTTDDEHVDFIIDIQLGLDEIKKQMRSTTRKLLNRALRNGLTGEIGLESQKNFYQIYSTSMHNIGNPTFGHKFFNNVVSAFPKSVYIVSLHHQEKILGGGYIAQLDKSVHCLWSGLLRNYYNLYISHFLYWEVIKFAYQNGYERVNLGRCQKNSGIYFFKEGFGGRAQPLYQQFYLNGIRKMPPVGAEMEDELKYRLFTSIWRLLPVKLTEIIGPKVRKVMPFG